MRIGERLSGANRGGWAPSLAWAILIAVLLLLPAGALPSTPFWIPSTFNGWIDCLVHGFLFFVLAHLLLRAGERRRERTPVPTRQGLLLLLALLYAIALELLQVPVPGRSLQVIDMVFAALGIGCAWFAFRRSRERLW